MKKLTRQLSLGSDANSNLRKLYHSTKQQKEDSEKKENTKAPEPEEKVKVLQLKPSSLKKPSIPVRAAEAPPTTFASTISSIAPSLDERKRKTGSLLDVSTSSSLTSTSAPSSPLIPLAANPKSPSSRNAPPKPPKMKAPPPIPPLSAKPNQLSPRSNSAETTPKSPSPRPLPKAPSPRRALSDAPIKAPSSPSITSSPVSTPPASPATASSYDEKWADPEKEAQRQKQNKNVLEELVKTEKEYTKDIETIVEHVMKPMTLKKNFLTGEPLVTPAQVSAIFSNLALLPPLNAELAKMLSIELQKFNEGKEAMIGKIFLGFADFFRMYTQYFSNQPNSMKTISELRQDLQFDAFLEEKRDLIPEFKNLDMAAMLIKPTQRMCKYPLFLRELVNCTRRTHPDFPNLVAALEKVDSVVKEINERKRETENQAVLSELKATVVDDDKFMIVKIGRSLIKQGFFKKIVWKGSSFKGSVCIFSDAIMVTKAKDKKQSYKMHVDIDKYSSLTESEVGEKASLTNLKKAAVFPAFTINFDSDHVTVCCTSADERKQFVEAITGAKAAHLEKLAAPTRTIAIQSSSK
eukprot:TRINITY_DN361_c0_g1_i1.p1 TRINITY_DN361_c0_g1~~TRINITY_DN361_c0_g1_i1.p1  ORF type:complete len:578 (+),score=130.09 TRINITY_DN361_c0_g1_i1:169-1902(+)